MFSTRTLGVAGLLLLGGWLVISGASVSAQVALVQTSPMEITTDTPEYCRKLLDRMSSLARLATTPLPREVTDLTSEGQRMCDHGQTRGGIMRLRSALMIMERGNGPAYR
ncbi:MAG TPA: hypothetical protein VGM32_06150 [Rhodopila sp.]|jgi:hypothetical protein